MRAVAAMALAGLLAASGTGTAFSDASRDGPPAQTQTPNGRTLAADDPHRQPGKALARPIIAGPIEDSGAPALLYLHGGGWVVTGRRALEDNRHTIRRWSSSGVAVWGADYRRDRLSLPDADAAYRALRRRVGARRRICVMGESSGGALALLLAAKYKRIRCVVTYAAVGDLRLLRSGPLASEARDWLLPFGGYRRWDPLTNAGRIRQPVLLVHHAADAVVSAAHSRRLATRLAHATLVVMPSAASGGVRTTHGERTPAAIERGSFLQALCLVRAYSALGAVIERRASPCGSIT